MQSRCSVPEQVGVLFKVMLNSGSPLCGQRSKSALRLPPGLSVPGMAVVNGEFCTISPISIEHLLCDLVKPSTLSGGRGDFPVILWRSSCGAVTHRSSGWVRESHRIWKWSEGVQTETSSGSEAGLRKQKQVSSRWGSFRGPRAQGRIPGRK